MKIVNVGVAGIGFMGTAESFCGHALIDTPFQRGASEAAGDCNPERFRGFPGDKPLETVFHQLSPSTTPLKRGVNETSPWGMPKKWDAHHENSQRGRCRHRLHGCHPYQGLFENPRG